jgi:hypothetical protein
MAPGQIATFVWSFKTPLTIKSGIYRFNGDLALATAPSVQIHPEGYHQEATCAFPQEGSGGMCCRSGAHASCWRSVAP